jgi:hypothetical protein
MSARELSPTDDGGDQSPLRSLTTARERLEDWVRFGGPNCVSQWPEIADDIAVVLASEWRLMKALAVFAAIKPSDLHPADGSEAEPYVIMLHDPRMLGQGGTPDFTGADLANARALVAKTEGRF